MSIVLNEREWAEKAIESHELGKKPVETLNRVARYYLSSGYGKRDVRGKLETFLVQCDPNISLFYWSDALDRITRKSDKYGLIDIPGIDITVPEMETINGLGKRQLRRLAFTLLCVAKYWDEVSESNNHWVNTKDSDILRMANISVSIKKQSLMFGELNELSLLQFSKKIDNLNVRVLFMEDGETAIHIHDFRNLGYQYLRYCGEPYFECESCGVVTKLRNPGTGRKQKYCPNCALEIKTRQSVNAVMRRRATT